MTRWPLPRRRLRPTNYAAPILRNTLRVSGASIPQASAAMLDRIATSLEARRDAERPARAMSTRRRLHTLHWAGCDLCRIFRLGPTWRGSRA